MGVITELASGEDLRTFAIRACYLTPMNGLERARARNRGLRDVVSQYLPQSRPPAHDHNDWTVAGPAFIARATRTMQALDALQDGLFNADASVLLRVLYDHMAMFAWVAVEPETRLPRLIAEDYRKRLVAQDRLERLGGPTMPSDVRAYFERQRDAITERLPNAEEVARQADEHWGRVLSEIFDASPVFTFYGMYSTIFRNASASVHPTVMGLHPMTTTDPEHGQLIIDANGEHFAADGSNAFTVAPNVFAMGLMVAGEVLGAPSRESVVAVVVETDDT